ncbi:MAG: DUF4271 domain-containing protein [Prevotellaceae bacterium]|nr:DUF4271 domain-containing protein [Prevotellaceae bacterium]MDO4932347.1 DUF4271 domain-containing protein [Prevotellaceae bacterium]
MTVSDTIYKESFFKGNPLYEEEVPVHWLGESGDPVAYTLVNDSLISMVLLLCLLVTLITLARSRRLVRFQLKNLFRVPRENSVELRETAYELRYQTYFCLQGVILLGILAYSITSQCIGDDFVLGRYATLGIFCGIFAAYNIVHETLLYIVHSVFFDRVRMHLDYITRLFFMAVQGALLLPITLVHIYFQLNAVTTLKVLLVALALPMLMCFYKSYNIFFRKRNSIMQFFLYLCTLEAVPLALLTGILLYAAQYSTQNL